MSPKKLEIGDKLTQEEIEETFNTDFGYRITGINYRNPDQEDRYIILTSKEDSPYDDIMDRGTEFYYIGEGLPDKGDQEKTPGNKALIEAIQHPIPIYLFVSRNGKWEYQGLADVIDYQYISDGKRMVYRFKMRKLEISGPKKIEETQKSISKQSEEEPDLEEERGKYEPSERNIRSSVFSQKVKEEYNFKCAFCGARRFSPEGNPEVESAHIYPVEEGGSDDLRNGIALCKLHHWGFDYGWLSLNDDLEVIVNKESEEEIPSDFLDLEGEKINLPEDSEYKPHSKFLEAHRKLHGFSND